MFTEIFQEALRTTRVAHKEIARHRGAPANFLLEVSSSPQNVAGELEAHLRLIRSVGKSLAVVVPGIRELDSPENGKEPEEAEGGGSDVCVAHGSEALGAPPTKEAGAPGCVPLAALREGVPRLSSLPQHEAQVLPHHPTVSLSRYMLLLQRDTRPSTFQRCNLVWAWLSLNAQRQTAVLPLGFALPVRGRLRRFGLAEGHALQPPRSRPHGACPGRSPALLPGKPLRSFSVKPPSSPQAPRAWPPCFGWPGAPPAAFQLFC